MLGPQYEAEDVWTEFEAIAEDVPIIDDRLGNAVDPVPVSGDTFCYASELSSLKIHIQHEKEKGIAFQIWPSSLTLARFAELKNLETPGHWYGKRVLELGCGCGLVGLVFAALGATVLLTDVSAVLDLLRKNIALNQDTIEAAGGRVEARELCWGSTRAEEACREWGTPDLVVAADVIYYRELFVPLFETLREFSESTEEFLLAHVRRWKHDKLFFNKARKVFDVIDITAPSGEVESSSAVGKHNGSHTSGAARLFQLKKRLATGR